ncbi:vascular-related unknown protein 1 [Humulus lupulus]|uniref:vascular-related unknown protein 1 n=1 Tax=Humulus lupulus TaxID=3486 RepID=UPI002B404CFE|nr:vascular-related unknown protein 1 [Humulus lupulus]
MENSHSSSMTKPTSPNSEYCSEESGWTAYFQDFSNNNNNNNIHNNDHDEEEGSLISYGSSLVSDAASYAAWKISHQRDRHHHQPRGAAAGPSIAAAGGFRPPKKLTFKKTRTREISSDDSLEDTASSPVNSPKVGDLKRVIDMKTKHTADHFLENNSVGKKGGTLEYYSEMQGSEERSVVDFNEPNDCIDLKKRGLCLVPLSMLVNYLG